MKKLLALSLLTTALCLPSMAAETLGLTLDLDLNVERINFQGLEYFPEAVVTNVATDWIETQQITTNGLFSSPPNEITTNAVQSQVETVTIQTNAAYWSAPFVYTIPAGAPLQIGAGLTATPQRKVLLDVELTLTPAQLSAILGPDFAALTQLAAQTFGILPVEGNLDAALKAAVLATFGVGP